MILDILRNELFLSLLILVVSFLIAKATRFLLKTYGKKLAERTKTDIDDIIIYTIYKPVYLFIIFAGIYTALRTLSFLSAYIIWIDRAFYIISILLVSVVLSKLFNIFIPRILKVQKKFEKTPRLIEKTISVFIYIIAFLMILDYLNIEITPLVATLGLGGLAVGLALQNTLSNLFAGIHIISDRPVNIGDYIELENGLKGYVEDIGWRSTKIRTLPNTIVVVPNARLAETIIVNNSLPVEEMSVVIQCGVSYGSDLKKVERVTIETAKKIQETVPGAVKTFEPFIRYHTFGDSNINFSIILRVEKFVDRYLTTHEFIKALKERYDQEGIEISWPIRKIYYGDKDKKSEE